MKTWLIHINGRVQGVGFRPFIKRLADDQGFHGSVKNTNHGVALQLEADERQLEQFIEGIKAGLPTAARISELTVQACDGIISTKGFQILNSTMESTSPSVQLTPDLAICDDCKREVHASANHRHAYAFTSCTNCGPRYSVIKALPYDRGRTTMEAFETCERCNHEYADATDRRFHAQSISCPNCAVELCWLDDQSHQGDPVNEVVDRLRSGQVVAVKGTGGFLLLADASNAEAVQCLRERKARPTKPFACLYPNMEMIAEHCMISAAERSALRSPVAPIVLLKTKSTAREGLPMELIAPELNRLGIMLPSNALLEIIADRFEAPLIATSGNVSGAPICFTNDQARNHLSVLADAILGHDLEITTPLDDSVMAFTDEGRRIILRRARGMAPERPFKTRFDDGLLAVGAEMKSAFALSTEHQLMVSQSLGDTSTYDAQRMYTQTLDHLSGIMAHQVNALICDLHPDYFTTQWAMHWKEDRGVDVYQVQHHQAHLAALLCEHDLISQSEPLLGFVWDGTGYGADGNIWGGEIFRVEDTHMDRVGHLDYSPVLAGQRMMKEPPVALLALSGRAEWVEQLLPSFDMQVLCAVRDSSTLRSSSMGRLFDAVAALLLRIKLNRYEGEAALRLQTLAASSRLKAWQPLALDYTDPNLSAIKVIEAIHDGQAHQSAADLALRFHQSLVEWVRGQAKRHGVKRLAFSGGVFQNDLLIDLLDRRLGTDHDLFFHELLPANDECVAVGQLAYHTHFNPSRPATLNSEAHVFSRSW